MPDKPVSKKKKVVDTEEEVDLSSSIPGKYDGNQGLTVTSPEDESGGNTTENTP